MTKSQSLTDNAPKLFEVTYCVEQGYAIQVEAHTSELAELIVEQRMDNGPVVLCGSKRVHHAHFVNTVQELVTADFCVHRDGILAPRTNQSRARSAEKVLTSFSRDTGSEIGREALHDLLCDLGHYADQLGLDFEAEIARAAETWAEEK